MSAIAPSALRWTAPDCSSIEALLALEAYLAPFKMTGGSEDSSPVDFAFEPPAVPSSLQQKTPSFTMSSSTGVTPSTGAFQYSNMPYYSSGSSFSSVGSVTGSSFSSADALPAISREFARPSPTETRRPATAGGAMSRGPFAFSRPGSDERPETIDENHELFANPFDIPVKDNDKGSDQVDPHYVPSTRRASDSHFNVPSQPSYSAQTIQQLPMASAPPHINHFSYFVDSGNQHSQLQGLGRVNVNARPQTSDGLPSYTGMSGANVPLPSARTIVNQIDPQPYFTSPFTQREEKMPPSVTPAALMPFRDTRSLGDIHQPGNNFPGNRSYSLSENKTVRASYASNDDRPTSSGSSNTPGAGLTFVPLGGPVPRKRPRRRFDEIERLYLCGWNGCEKAYGTLNHLNAHVAMQKHGDKRLPAEFKDMRKAWRKKKREQTASASNGSFAPWQSRPSISSSESDFDRRDSTFSMSEASSHRGSVASNYTAYSWNDPSRPGSSHSYVANRRPSAPMHMTMPPQPMGFRQEGTSTPTQQNPFPGQLQPQPRTMPNYGFPTLTSAMPMGSAQQSYSQFAFQR
ncbi:hypothetical protein BCR39DRAFT_557250 [Naematelia encephala]|uniref:C2H2-type domain-containing protein n=1 Tax=Naematelia encephala TaxID=71784 RepID=A0A1Y2BE02_9TREE|nr:hypothetical protein BCR39DRAFT_557250 [Naematelia encephala]